MNCSNMPLEKLTGSIPCQCGRTHELTTIRAAVVDDAPAELAKELSKAGEGGRLLMLCDQNTYEALGRRAEQALRGALPLDICMLRAENLHADEEALGSALMALRPDTTRIVAVGSGTINDIARFVASRAKIPYDVLGTAPSMDGFVSSVSPLIRRGFKITFEAVAPERALLDLPAMREAPLPMIAAGLGDVMGKYTALADWAMARDVYGEAHCEQIATLMRRAVDTCAESSPGLSARQAQSIRSLGEGLLLSGIAMQMAGNSRPASGAEHHIAHFWEIRQLARGEKPTLHGDKVGYAVLLVLDYYRLFFERMRPQADYDPDEWMRGLRAAFGPVADEVLGSTPPDGVPSAGVVKRARERWEALQASAREMAPLRGSIASMLRACGGPVTAQELGLSKEDVRDALLYAKEIRTRPTIMRLAFAWGVHAEICEEIMEELYAEGDI